MRIYQECSEIACQLKLLKVLGIFYQFSKLLEKYGDIKHEEMYEIFNMGIGMVIAVAPENAEALKKVLNAFEIGKMVKRQDSAVVIKK